MNIDIKQYIKLFGTISSSDFNRLSLKAVRTVENHTTGVDGYNKLRKAFPSDAADIECVHNCVYEIIHTMQMIEEAESEARNLRGTVTREDGTVMPKVVASISSGSESISFKAASSVDADTIHSSDVTKRRELMYSILADYLGGVADANGVNLLYMGVYPHV